MSTSSFQAICQINIVTQAFGFSLKRIPFCLQAVKHTFQAKPSCPCYATIMHICCTSFDFNFNFKPVGNAWERTQEHRHTTTHIYTDSAKQLQHAIRNNYTQKGKMTSCWLCKQPSNSSDILAHMAAESVEKREVWRSSFCTLIPS